MKFFPGWILVIVGVLAAAACILFVEKPEDEDPLDPRRW